MRVKRLTEQQHRVKPLTEQQHLWLHAMAKHQAEVCPQKEKDAEYWYEVGRSFLGGN
tara:strand:+ start:2325 stop:2495 length:171 start_codon:yes stop_codon:yes gene_type:complete